MCNAINIHLCADLQRYITFIFFTEVLPQFENHIFSIKQIQDLKTLLSFQPT